MRLPRHSIVLIAGLLSLASIAAKPVDSGSAEVNVLVVGDTAGDTPERAMVTAALTRHVANSGEHFDAAVMLGDTFTMTLHGPDDPTFGRRGAGHRARTSGNSVR